MNPTPTPFDIIDPFAPPVEVTLLFWVFLIGSFALLWMTLWYVLKKKRLHRSPPALLLETLVNELRELTRRYEESENRELLHLFVRTVRRHPKIQMESTQPLLDSIESERFSPSPSAAVTSHMKEVLSILTQWEGRDA